MKTIAKSLCYAIAGVLLWTGVALSAAQKLRTLEEIDLYKGKDRQPILEEGAKKEGKLTFYTTGILNESVLPVIRAFEKKYPFIKVDIWRADSAVQLARVIEEIKAEKLGADIIEASQRDMLIYTKAGVLQSFYSPELAYNEEAGIMRGADGNALAVGIYKSATGLGYNTKLISENQLPKTYHDLLNPNWKAKVPLAAVRGPNWITVLVDVYGEGLVKQLAEQNFVIHDVAPRALLDMVIAGEYAFSPHIAEPHVVESLKKGAPIGWLPLEPALITTGLVSLPRMSLHPYAAMLFLDFEITRESAEIRKGNGYNPFRKDVLPIARDYKTHLGPKSAEEATAMNNLWRKLFLRK